MLTHVTGDATKPTSTGPRILVHCVNDKGLWGAGFVLALSKQWPFAEEAYRAWASSGHNWAEINERWPNKVDVSGPFELGAVQLVLVAPKLWVANLVGQHGVDMGPDRRPPIRYDAIQNGFKKVFRLAQIHSAHVAMPKMGAGLAGGNWNAIEKLVHVELSTKGTAVTVYSLPSGERA